MSVNTWTGLPTSLDGETESIEWPPRFPDLTQMDFLFWLVVKDKVYSRNPYTVYQSKNFIDDVFKNIRSNQNFCHTVCQSVADMLLECINTESGHFEHLHD
ncbi:hypothetical protein TNIN_415131 [Trichonephila inaurata madagascariensis]|uniref:Uncharacterized protein n=1 Tax=Trichonephila inaurata madagascariensis TaxID=2747483 RepID=A0A8X6IGP7_9ARAC|nr:hypothetical protein TNIN_415131 [Trichonephila inaurata madagascariensis]